MCVLLWILMIIMVPLLAFQEFLSGSLNQLADYVVDNYSYI